MKAFCLIMTFLTFLITPGRAQEHCRILFYNTENLFDTVNDSICNDDEFLPDGSRRWSRERYFRKLEAVSKVIIAAGGWEPPDIVGLCEVENRRVLYDLTGKSVLAGAGYSFIHYDSPDPRGIDVCMLYRPSKVRIVSHESWTPASAADRPFTSRSVLFVKAIVSGDTINLIFCHLPSRREGVMASSRNRSMVAELIVSKIDSLTCSSHGSEKVVVMGDMNVPVDDDVMMMISQRCQLMNLTERLSEEGRGTYKFRGDWEMIDQALISYSLIPSEEEVMTESPEIRICDLEFLLEDDPDYPGKRPFSSYRGYEWRGGYSDHLPLMLTLTL